MKFGLTLLLVAGVSLAPVTQVSAQSQSTEPTQQELRAEFETAKSLYDQGRFNQAYAAFEQLWQKATSSWVVNFYLARCALEIKRYDDAMAAFDRVLILNSSHTRTRLELARLYYEIGEFEMANNELDIALQAPLPEPVKNNVLALKAKMSREQVRHSHAVTLVLGLNYDSNASNDIGGGNSFELPGFNNIELAGNDEVEDFGFGQTLVYNHGYDFGERGGWALSNQVVGFNKLNNEVSANNVLYLAASSAPTYVHDIYKVSFPFEFDKVYLDNEAYMSTLGFGANLSQIVSPTQTIQAGYKLKNMRYDGNKDLNALANVYSLGYRQAFAEKTLVFGAQLIYEARQQNSSAATDPASLNEVLLKVDASKTLSAKWRLNGAISYRTTNYIEVDTLFANKRSDQVTKLDFGAAYLLDAKSSVSGGLSHAMHDSNQGSYEYQKTLVSFNYVKSF